MRIVSASSLVLSLLALAPSHAAECRNPVACMTVSPGLHAHITLAPSSTAGVVTVEQIETGPPPALVVEWSDVSCGADRDLELSVNDVRFAIAAPCAVGARTFVLDDASAIASVWRDRGPNILRLSSRGRDGAIASARVRAGEGLASPSTRLLAGAGTLRGAFELSASVVPGRPTVPRLRVPFTGSHLPSSIDISALTNGPHALCVGTGVDADCVTFLHDGEQTLQIGEPSGSGTLPVANAGPNANTECASAYGTPVTLNGTASTGAIILYEWFENYGTPYELSLGTGVQVQASLPLGTHVITLKVTDAYGYNSTATTEQTVRDTTAPVVRVSTNPVGLWPADHRMVDVLATPAAVDVCGGSTIVLVSVTSNEPDDAAGDADGNTTGDIQGVTTGTDDRNFQLRAETGPVFGGRRYLITYAATDGSGNRGVGRVAVTVVAPHRPLLPVEDEDASGPLLRLQRPAVRP